MSNNCSQHTYYRPQALQSNHRVIGPLLHVGVLVAPQFMHFFFSLVRFMPLFFLPPKEDVIVADVLAFEAEVAAVVFVVVA